MKTGLAWLLPALLGSTLLAGCSGGTGPTAGMLSVNLTTPRTDDGGLLLTISGGPVDSIEAAGHRLYYSRPEANTVHFILAGEIASGTIARIHVPDTRQAFQYTALVGQVAARSSYVPRDPAQYEVVLVP
jgi:hypothetical protein